MRPLLLTKEVAEILRVSEEYVRELIRRGKIRAYKEGRRSGFRVSPDDVEAYIQEKYKEFNPEEDSGLDDDRDTGDIIENEDVDEAL